MRHSMNGGWERVRDTTVAWCGYALLALATVLAALDPRVDPGWLVTTVLIAAGAGAWIFVLYTRTPQPRAEHRARNLVFFVGLLGFGSVLMARDPVFFVFVIAGFFYASELRPIALAVLGIGATS